MSSLRSNYAAPPERLRFASNGQILVFGLITVLILLAVYPRYTLQRHLERAAKTDSVSIAYLMAWLRAKPDDDALRLLLAQRLFERGDLLQSEQQLQTLFSRDDQVLTEDTAQAHYLLLQIRERQVWQQPQPSTAFTQAKQRYLQQLWRVSRYRWPLEINEQLARKALAFSDFNLARTLYFKLINESGTLNLSWFEHIATIYQGEKNYTAAAHTLLQAMNRTQNLAQKKHYFLQALKALQAGNLLAEAMTTAERYGSFARQDAEVLEYLARLALATNRPDLAEKYVALLLKQRVTTGGRP